MTDGDDDALVYNGNYEVEVLIDRPAAQVWTPLLDDSLWVTNFDVERVSGELGKVGFITRLYSKGESMKALPPPHYHYCKVIKLIPHRQQLLKSYTEKGGSYGMQSIGFDDTRLVEVGNQTKVIFNVYWSVRGASLPDPATQEAGEELSREGMLKNLNNLKRLVESL